MECEVKEAEINILRKRIQTMQEQIERGVLPNGSSTVQSHLQPPPEEMPPEIKVCECLSVVLAGNTVTL